MTKLRNQALKNSEAALSSIIDRRAGQYSKTRVRLKANYFYRAAVIVRNVLHRGWDVETVAFELSLLTGEHDRFNRQQKRFDEGKLP